MKNILSHFPFRPWAGASFALVLSLAGCTEKKSGPPPVTPPTTTTEVNAEARAYNLYTEEVWSDDFNGGAIDQSKWGYDLGGGGWGNNELQAYTNSNNNAFVSGGNLTIVARREQSGNNAYTSARLLTKGKQNFVFGRTDIRAKIPKGKGIWPAIWMLGADIDQNNWPKCGEIDIMELRGSRPTELLSTMHFGDPNRVLRGTTAVQPVDLSLDYHIYSAVRSKDQIRFFIDGTQYFTFNRSDVGSSPYPFNNPFFMILNVAVGGDFDGNPDASTTFPQQMLVDYVKLFQYK
jgi:beta-glucanase (GH16 family)